MSIEAEAMLAMSGYDVEYESRRRILKIIRSYERGELITTDCTGCIWKTGLGCVNRRLCRRDELEDLYKGKE